MNDNENLREEDLIVGNENATIDSIMIITENPNDLENVGVYLSGEGLEDFVFEEEALSNVPFDQLDVQEA